MIRITELLQLLVVGALFGVPALFAFSTGPRAPVAGVPSDVNGQNCTLCHRTFAPANSDGRGKLEILVDKLTYTPGITKKIRISIAHPEAQRWGFQFTSRTTRDTTKGAGVIVPNDNILVRCGLSISLPPCGGEPEPQFVSHTQTSTRAGTRGGVEWEFDWTPPPSEVGDITFYVAGNAANSNGTSADDYIYTANLTLTHSLNTDAPRQITTFAGTGAPAFSGDTGPATAAALNMPPGVTVDGTNGVYIADAENHRIRLVAPDGTIRTVAGIGTPGATGDNGQATAAQLFSPLAIAMDGSGGFYIADTGNHRIRRVFANGIIVTVAGTGTPGFSGDGGFATAAQLQSPSGVAVDSQNSVYIADYGNHRIRKLSATGIVTTYAGTGTAAFSGDGGNATAAHLNGPWGVAVNSARDVFIADAFNHRIRRVIAPAIVPTTFDSLPSGLTLTIGGTAITAPATLQLEAGATISISAPAPSHSPPGPASGSHPGPTPARNRTASPSAPPPPHSSQTTPPNTC
jgi:hypothetical protein